MPCKSKIGLTLCGLLLIELFLPSVTLLNVAKRLRSIRNYAANIDTSTIEVPGPESGMYAVGAGRTAYRSSVISSISQMDRGEKEKAMKTLQVAIASLSLETTQVYALPVMSAIIDRVIKKYGSQFPKTVSGLKSYNQMLGDAMLNQVAAVDLLDHVDESIDVLETLKLRIKTDFGQEVTSLLASSQANADVVRPLRNAKTWAKVAKWGDFLAGPIFDAVNIAFIGWQLGEAIQEGNKLGIASSSLGIIGSVVGISAFLAGSLATAGGVIAATAGPIGAIIGCVLTLASLIIDIINEYNPSKKIDEHLKLVRSLTSASKEMALGFHTEMLQKGSADTVVAGFGTMYEINQAMLVDAKIHDEWDSIKGFNNYSRHKIDFTPELVRRQNDYWVVGDVRVFDKRYYANWIFKPSEREEIGHDFYGKTINEADEGIFVRVVTDMVTNKEDNMWFWLFATDVTTYEQGAEDAPVSDNVEIGDFRTFVSSSHSYIHVNTGGGDDLLLLSGVVGSAEQESLLVGHCLIARMGQGHDTISFEGMDTREEKLKWFLKNDDLSLFKPIVGVIIDIPLGLLSYNVENPNGSTNAESFGGFDSVESIIGSPLNDVIKFDTSMDLNIKETEGDNTYELSLRISLNTERIPKYSIEDNSDTPGILIIYKTHIFWNNIIFCHDTNTITIMDGAKMKAQIFLKRSKDRLDDFRVQINNEMKHLGQMEQFGSTKSYLIPFTPYEYRFDRDLVALFDQPTYVDLHAPSSTFPETIVSHRIKFLSPQSCLFISDDLVNFLENGSFSLIAKRQGNSNSEGSWEFTLKIKNSPRGWRINIDQIGEFYYGTLGNSRFLFSLRVTEHREIDIYSELTTITTSTNFDYDAEINNFEGGVGPDKLFIRYPLNLAFRPLKSYVIDLKGPKRPTETHRNELVLTATLIIEHIRYDMDRYSCLELERRSVSDHWHLKIYANWGKKELKVDATLKNVHFIVADALYNWKTLLDLTESTEVFYSLDRIIRSQLRDLVL